MSLSKTKIRKAMLDWRAGVPADQAQRSARQAAGHLKRSGLLNGGPIVAAYHAVGSEFPTAPLLQTIHKAAATAALPTVTRQGQMLMRAVVTGRPKRRNRYGIPEPMGNAVLPDIVLLPLTAFDLAGNRLGMGGGYYDRYLGSLLCSLLHSRPALLIGLAFSEQAVDNIPTEPHDIAMDAILTEHGFLYCNQ